MTSFSDHEEREEPASQSEIVVEAEVNFSLWVLQNLEIQSRTLQILTDIDRFFFRDLTDLERFMFQVIVREAKQEPLHPAASPSSPCPVHGLLMEERAENEIEVVPVDEKELKTRDEKELKSTGDTKQELEMTECSEEIITYQPVAKNKFKLSKVDGSLSVIQGKLLP